MSQIAIYLEENIQKQLDRAVKLEGKSRSAWVKEAIVEKINSGLPDSWFKLWGTWEDNRSPEEILKDIRSNNIGSKRRPLK
ncbi:MAG: hypothetical protein HQM15_11710 [Deltaproteobacteria bacterium]|nr:hypothetical protein [Deltaproteobacteria bacterium]